MKIWEKRGKSFSAVRMEWVKEIVILGEAPLAVVMARREKISLGEKEGGRSREFSQLTEPFHVRIES